MKRTPLKPLLKFLARKDNKSTDLTEPYFIINQSRIIIITTFTAKPSLRVLISRNGIGFVTKD